MVIFEICLYDLLATRPTIYSYYTCNVCYIFLYYTKSFTSNVMVWKLYRSRWPTMQYNPSVYKYHENISWERERERAIGRPTDQFEIDNEMMYITGSVLTGNDANRPEVIPLLKYIYSSCSYGINAVVFCNILNKLMNCFRTPLFSYVSFFLVIPLVLRCFFFSGRRVRDAFF